SVVRVELYADFICGYFGAVQEAIQAGIQLRYPAAVQALNQFRSGDDLFEDYNHHGTPLERANAVQAGFTVGTNGMIPPSELVQLALDYVQKLKVQTRKNG